ncbi:hypothetical protein [Bacillus toyonensis]|uniref:hypothetical protein n=1 Tax=Bacillus toyonensis TaxID=155322 RepID=UPI000BF4761A|nr:hypothetical protein [Bacillus toyonensis]PGA40067.1 hypothetical protein COL85_26345 [Bacillus toyonensis]
MKQKLIVIICSLILIPLVIMGWNKYLDYKYEKEREQVHADYEKELVELEKEQTKQLAKEEKRLEELEEQNRNAEAKQKRMTDAFNNLRQGMSYEEVAAAFGTEGDLKNQGTYSNEWKDYKKNHPAYFWNYDSLYNIVCNFSYNKLTSCKKQERVRVKVNGTWYEN